MDALAQAARPSQLLVELPARISKQALELFAILPALRVMERSDVSPKRRRGYISRKRRQRAPSEADGYRRIVRWRASRSQYDSEEIKQLAEDGEGWQPSWLRPKAEE